jgi:hypothetical protein
VPFTVTLSPTVKLASVEVLPFGAAVAALTSTVHAPPQLATVHEEPLIAVIEPRRLILPCGPTLTDCAVTFPVVAALTERYATTALPATASATNAIILNFLFMIILFIFYRNALTPSTSRSRFEVLYEPFAQKVARVQ